ncbi:MAG TPA: protein kinase [Gemmatimonadaceae bacterium]
MADHQDDDEQPSVTGPAGQRAGGTGTSDTGPHPQHPLLDSHLGSGLIAQQPTTAPNETVAVTKICPQCGGEYETSDRFCPKDGSPLRPKSGGDPLVGRVIAERYLILARLGEGGMGRVYLAEHVKMNRQCAIKVMNPSLVNDTESSQRFAREASNAARILHPNVAAVFDYGEADKVVYLVMEYVDGESLSAILQKDGALDPRRAIDLARQVADGLHAAHELGIVHRDLKPDNVIVTRNRAGKEIAKVVDFGIAKAVNDSKEDALTKSGLVIGTPEYMSPEQLLGDPVDARTDVYALGCILFQSLTGNAAFAADTREQMIRRRLHEPAPHIRDLIPALPARLDTLIVHMLARSPGDRVATAADARDQLDPALTLSGWDPRTMTQGLGDSSDATSIMPAAVITAPTDTQVGASAQPAKKGGRGMLVGSLIGVVAIAAAVVFFVNRQHAKQPVAPPATRVQTDSAQPVAATKPDTAGSPAGPGVLTTTTPKTDSAASAKPSKPALDTAAINQLVAAIRSGDIDKVNSKFPGMTDQQRGYFTGVIYGSGRTVGRAQAVWKEAAIVGDTAKMPLEIRVPVTTTATGQTQQVPLKYGAVFVRSKSGKFGLVALLPR